MTWPKVKLGEVLKHRKEFIQIDDFAPYKRCRVQLHAQGVVLRDQVPGSEIKTKRQQVCKAGEFLVAEIDAKHGGYGMVPDDLEGAIVSSHYFLFGTDDAKIDRRYLGWFIRTPAFYEQVAAQGSTNYAAIRPGHVLEYEIPLPPLAEQRRLVARIDALAARIDEGKGLRKEADKATSAVMPGQLGAYFRQVSEIFGTARLSELTSVVVDGPHKTPTYVSSGVPFVTVRNMVSGRLDFSNLQYVTPQDHIEFTRRCKPERGDVLYSKDGATRGRPCFVDTDQEFSIFVSVALIKPIREKLDGRYLCHLLNSTMIKDLMADKSRGDMIPHIVLREIKAFPVPTPSLVEQQRIVTHLDAIQTKANELRDLQSESAAELDAMLPAILDRAFRGEL